MFLSPHVRAQPTPVPNQDDDSDLDEEIDLPLAEELAGDDEVAGDADLDDLIPAIAGHDGDDSLDDAVASELDTGIDLDQVEEHGEGADDREIDVGSLDEGVSFDDAEGGDDRSEGAIGDADDLDLDDAASDDDGGAEGTSEAPENEVDEEALPELDADDEGEEGEEELAEALLAGASDTAVPWDAARWAPLEGAGAAVPCAAVSIAGGAVVAAGEVLLIVDDGARAARRAAFGAGSSAAAITDGLLVVATARGTLLLSTDGGKEASSLAGLRERPGPVDLAATSGRVWIRAGEALLCLSSPEKPLAELRAKGVMAMASSGGVVITLSREGNDPLIERLRGDDWQRVPLRGSAKRVAERAWAPRRGGAHAVKLAAAAAGRCLAITDGARVAVSRDAGQTFETSDLGPIAAVAFAGDEDTAPLLALSTPRAGAASLIQIPARGEPSRIAAVSTGAARGDADAPASPAAMAWDASRDCVWIACAAGLLALGRPRPH